MTRLAVYAAICTAVTVAAVTGPRQLRPVGWILLVVLALVAGKYRAGSTWLLSATATTPPVIAGLLLRDGRPASTVLLNAALAVLVIGALTWVAARVGLLLGDRRRRPAV